MPHDEALARMLRAGFGRHGGVSEKKMFGGLCFMRDGNMVCGAYRDVAMIRVGPDRAEGALALAHVRPMEMGGRRMKGFVEVDAEGSADPLLRERLLGMAFAFVSTLPRK